MFELLGIALFLVALLAINSLATFAVEAVCRLTVRLRMRWSNHLHARVLFVARVLPFTISMTLLFLLLGPAYIAYEPRHTTEEISFKLGFLALLSATGLLITIWRAVSSWRATRMLTRYWLSNATRISVDGVEVPAYRFRHNFPVIAVVGAIRPRLFIAEQVLEALSERELAAAIAHEKAHLATRDNLKRELLRACRDMLGIVPGGRYIDVAWARVSEAAADELASIEGRGVALDLASALVKVARLAPSGFTPTMPAGAFLIDGTDTKGISSRVGRLLQLSTGECEIRPKSYLAKAIMVVIPAVLLAALIVAMTSTPLLVMVHSFTEQVVHILR